jgi:hypothetical protein
MSKTTKETITTQDNGPTPVIVQTVEQPDATSYQTVEYLIYFLFGVLEVLLAFRLFLMMTGANLSSSFVSTIYNFTNIFVLPFNGIFNSGVVQGTGSANLVFEPSTLIALIVYAVLAFGIVKLIQVLSGKKQESD